MSDHETSYLSDESLGRGATRGHRHRHQKRHHIVARPPKESREQLLCGVQVPLGPAGYVPPSEPSGPPPHFGLRSDLKRKRRRRRSQVLRVRMRFSWWQFVLAAVGMALAAGLVFYLRPWHVHIEPIHHAP